MGPSLLVGAFGAGNLGDDLMLQSILLTEPDSKIVAYGAPRFRKPVRFILYEQFMDAPEAYFQGCAALRFGGGNLFWSEQNLISMLVIAQRAKLAGLKVTLNRVGLQSFEINARYSRMLVSLVDSISVRETQSACIARSLGRDDVILEEDYAFELIRTSQSTEQKRNQIPIVGINFSDVRLSTTNPEDAGFKNHIAGIFSEIARRFDGALEFEYIPFCNHQSFEPENDTRSADLLWNESKGKIAYANDITTTDDLVEKIRRLDALLGMRFHMFVLGFALRKHVIPLIESHRQLGKHGAIARDHGCEPIAYTSSQGFVIAQIDARLRRLLDAIEVLHDPTRGGEESRKRE